MDSEHIINQNNQNAEQDASVAKPADLPENISQGIRKPNGRIRRVVVDRSACIGAQSCVVVADKLFQLDDQNLAYVVDSDAHDEGTVLIAAQACPVLAIHLYDENGKRIFPEGI